MLTLIISLKAEKGGGFLYQLIQKDGMELLKDKKKKGKWNRIKISVDMSVRRRQSDVQTFKQVRLMFKNYLVVSKWIRLNPY